MGGQLKQRGLTLIEVMVALFILSLVMVGVVLSSSQAIRSTQRLHDRLMALWVVEVVGVELKANVQGKITTQSRYTGEQLMGETVWRWQAQAQPVEGLVRVDISVFEAEGPKILLTSPLYVKLP